MQAWHIDIFDFIDLRKTHGEDRRRAQDLFLSISIPSLFIERVKARGKWTLFDPYDTPDLADKWGAEFDKAYLEYERKFQEDPSKFNPNTETITAVKLLGYYIFAWSTTGQPFIFFKDNVNQAHKYGQKDGVIRSSNLCVSYDTKILTKEAGYAPIGALVENGYTKLECWNGSRWSETSLHQTSELDHLLTVELSNGVVINATEYHNWYVQDGTKSIETKTSELQPGDILEEFKLPNKPIVSDNLFKDNIVPIDQIKYITDGTHNVPGINHTVEYRIDWLSMLIENSGKLFQTTGNLLINSTDKAFLDKVMLFLQELGVRSSIIERYISTTIDVREWTLVISKKDNKKLAMLGLDLDSEFIKKTRYIGDYKHRSTVKVVSVTDNRIYAPTYCGIEPKMHKLMFNGVLTGNCQEVLQPTDHDTTAVCNLGSLNAARLKTDEEIVKVSQLLTRFLDNIIDVTAYSSTRPRDRQAKVRSIGCGVLGEAEYLATNHIHYGSEEHKLWVDSFYKLVSTSINEYSKVLAKEKGGCDLDKSVRNAYQMCVAPNVSTGVLAGSTSSHEPIFARVYSENSKIGTYKMVAPNISIDNIDYYKTAFEIPTELQLEVLAIRQKYVDMGISSSIYEESVTKLNASDIAKIIIKASDLGIKTLYYFRTKAPKDEYDDNKQAIVCDACEN